MRHRHRPLALLLALLALPAALPATLPAETDPVAAGDAAWARRGEGHQGGRAAAGPAGESVAAYERAVSEQPGRLAAQWKRLRALHVQGEYVARSREEKQRVFGQG